MLIARIDRDGRSVREQLEESRVYGFDRSRNGYGSNARRLVSVGIKISRIRIGGRSRPIVGASLISSQPYRRLLTLNRGSTEPPPTGSCEPMFFTT